MFTKNLTHMEIPINTSNFFKFIATLSLLGSIYFFSFPLVYLKQYSEDMSKLNIEKAELTSEYGYLMGKQLDLYTLCKDSLNNSLKYFYHIKTDTPEDYRMDTIRYHCTLGISKSLSKKVDSLNFIEKELGKVSFKSDAIKQMQSVLEKNIYIQEKIFWALGILCLIIFVLSTSIWYKQRHRIDNT